jgi:hypothetical protein
MADSPGAQPLYNLLTDLNTAKSRWGDLADSIGAGYNQAYNTHKDVLDHVANTSLADAQAYYFVLSMVAVSFAGGLPGALMAPWVGEQGIKTATLMRRAAVLAAESNAAPMVGQKLLDSTVGPPTASDELKPVVKDPLQFWLDMRVELDRAFSVIIDAIDNKKTNKGLIQTANQKNWTLEGGQRWADAFRKGCSLLMDAPVDADLPDQNQLPRDAELFMWMVWGSAQDMSFWNAIYQGMEFTLNSDISTYAGERQQRFGMYKETLEELDPILDRLRELGKSYAVYVRYRFRDDESNYLDLRKLNQLGGDEKSPVMRKLYKTVTPPFMNSRRAQIEFLNSLSDLPSQFTMKK